VVLRGREELGDLTIAERVQGNLHAFEQLLDDNALARRAEGFAHHDFVHGLLGLADAGREQHAFAECEAIGLHGAAAIKASGETLRRNRVGEGARLCGRDAVPLHKIL